jgi:maltose/moltooligosaccharide transporter
MQGTTLQWSLIALYCADKLDDKQMPLGFQMQSFFTGFGQTLANLSLFYFPMILLEKQALAYLGICFFLLRSRLFYRKYLVEYETTKEIPPTTAELEHLRSSKRGVLTHL